MVFHRRLSDSKSPQVSRTLLSILAVFNNAVVWMVSTRPPTSKSSTPFNNPLVTMPKAPTTIGIIVTFMFHRFFNSLARSRYLLLLLFLCLDLVFFFSYSQFLAPFIYFSVPRPAFNFLSFAFILIPFFPVLFSILFFLSQTFSINPQIFIFLSFFLFSF